MVFACGIDIEEKIRFNKHYFDKGKLSDLIYDIFTTKEIENLSTFGKEAFLKGFSFKEAFYKAISNPELGFLDLEIVFKSENDFDINLSKNAKSILKVNNIVDIKTSCEEENDYVIFKVVLIN